MVKRHKGKYERRLGHVFFGLLVSLSSLFVGIVFALLFQMNRQENDRIMKESLRKSLDNLQIREEIMLKALKEVENSQAYQRWVLSEDLSAYYLESIQLQQQLLKVSTNYLQVNFTMAVSPLDEEEYVITPLGTPSKALFASENGGFKIGQAEGVFVGQEGLIFQVIRQEDERTIVFDILMPYAGLFGQTDDQVDWMIYDTGGKRARKVETEQSVVITKASSSERTSFTKQEAEPTERIRDGRYYLHYPMFNQQADVILSYKRQRLTWTLVLGYFVLPLLAVVGLTLLLSGIISRRLYHPMRQVVADMQELASIGTIDDFTGEDDFTSDDEFQLVRWNLFKVEELNRRLLTLAEEKDELFIQKSYRDVLFGTYRHQTPVRKSLGLIETASYYVGVIDLAGGPKDDKAIYYLKQHLMLESKEEGCLHYVNLDYLSCALIIATESIGQAEALAYQLLETVDADNQFNLRVAISSASAGIDGLHECYKQSRRILGYRYLYGNKRVLTCDRIEERPASHYVYPLSLENKLIYHALDGDQQALVLFDELIEENRRQVSLAPEAFKNLAITLVGTLHRILQELKEEGQTIDISQIMTLSQQGYAEQVIHQIRQALADAVDAVRQSKDSQENQITNQLLDYIHQWYQTDIMLPDLAKELNVSEKYCSVLFKKYVGQNYRTYLNNYRIRQAIRLLEECPDKKIYVVAEAVGFNSSNTFIRVFAKYAGMTPKAFVETVKKKNAKK